MFCGCATLDVAPLEGSVPAQVPGQCQVALAQPASGISITPRQIVAPVGSEVLLVGSVCGGDGFMVTAERVDWTIQGCGQFLGFSQGNWIFAREQQINPRYVMSSTSRQMLLFDRGTPDRSDDVTVLPGQAWVSVRSLVEGTSSVTAHAPNLGAWQRRQDSALIYWVDAEWAFPPPATSPAGGRHRFTTIVTRHSNHGPAAGWVVRYEIAGGAAAGFAPDGAQAIEATTDASGQATAEIMQTDPQGGTTTVNIQIIRPATAGSPRMVIGSGNTHISWSAPGLTLRKSGPAQLAVGAAGDYQIAVANNGSVAASGVTVTEEIPPGMTFTSADPQPSSSADRRVVWQFSELQPGAETTIQLKLTPAQPGTFACCTSAAAADGLAAQDCVTTVVGQPASNLQVRVAGPNQARVGDNVSFEITVTNRGDSPATGLLVRDAFDDGLKHEAAQSPIERDLEDLGPGKSLTFGVTFSVTAPGRQCQRIEVSAADGQPARAEHCLQVAAAAGAKLSVRKSGPRQQQVGDQFLFDILVTNQGSEAVRNVKVTDAYDLNFLRVLKASAGHEPDPPNLVWVLDSIPPGDTVRLQVLCQALAANPRACNRVTVEAAGARIQDEACVEIRAAQAATAPLQVSLTPLNAPIRVGEVTSYLIRVENEGETPQQAVVVLLNVPPELMFDSVGRSNPTRHRLQGGQVIFEPLPQLQPGQRQEFEVRLKAVRAARRPNPAQLTAEVMVMGASQPVRARDELEIYEQAN